MEEYQDNGAAATRRYLLGQLAEDEQRRFEEELMSGARSFEELLSAEDELVDQYVAGELAAAERARFEQYFLATPERRRKLSFARTLRRYIADASLAEVPVEGETAGLSSAAPSSTTEATGEETAEETADEEAPADSASKDASLPPADGGAPRPSAWSRLVPSFLRAQPPLARAAFAAILVLVFSVGALLLYNAARGTRTGGPTLAFTLTSGAVRGASDGGVKQLQIAPGTGTVELRLVAPAPARRRYRADILTVAEDRPVFSAPEEIEPATDAAGTHVPVRVPAALLPPGDYKLTLTGARADGNTFEDIATYYFRVIQ